MTTTLIRFALFAIFAVLLASPATSQQKKKPPVDLVPGAANWKWLLTDEKGQNPTTGTLKATTDGKVFNNISGKEIGAWKMVGKTLNLDVNGTQLKGKGEFKMVPAPRPTFEGILNRPDGNFKLRIEFGKD